MNSVKETEELGLSEVFTDPAAYVVIEWAQRLGALLPKERTDIHFSVLDHEKHKIIIT